MQINKYEECEPMEEQQQKRANNHTFAATGISFTFASVRFAFVTSRKWPERRQFARQTMHLSRAEQSCLRGQPHR